MINIYSDNLVRFFLEMDLVNDNCNADYSYLGIEDKTNLYDRKLYICYPIEINYDQIYVELSKLLKVRGHSVSESTVKGFLCMLAICDKDVRDINDLSHCISFMSNFKIKQYVFFKSRSSEFIKDVSFRDFTLGKINYEKFEVFLKNHSNTDYADRYRLMLDNSIGITTRAKVMPCLDVFRWVEYVKFKKALKLFPVNEIIDVYLNGVATDQLYVLEKEFDQKQEFLTAYFGLHYDIRAFWRFGSTVVNVFFGFMDDVKEGWVVPLVLNFDVSFPNQNIFEEAKPFLKRYDAAIANFSGEYGVLLKTVGKFFANGERLISKEEYSIAFIELMVGLDFLLNPDTQKSKKLKQRISLLVHEYFDNTFLAQQIILDNLYDKRSDYVHNGKYIDIEDTLLLRDISKVIYAILFNLHVANQRKVRIDRKEWIRMLDRHLVRIFEKNILPNKKERRLLGVLNLNNTHTSEFIKSKFKQVKA